MIIIIVESLIRIWGWCDPELPTYVCWGPRAPKRLTYTVVADVAIEMILIHWSCILNILTIIVLFEKRVI